MYVVDASVWVGWFIPNDFHHSASYEWLGHQAERSEVVASPAILLAEVGGAVARRTGDSELGARAVALMHRLPNLRVVAVDATFGRFSADLAAEHRLRGADSLYAALAQRLNVPLVTWDHDQLEPGSAAISVFTPATAPEQLG